MTNAKEWISPSKEQTEKLTEKIRIAMLASLQPIFEYSDDREVKDVVKIIFSAAKIGFDLERDANKEFEDSHPENHTHSYYIEIMKIIASCLMHGGDLTTFPAYTIGSQVFEAFASAISILEAASNLESALDCDISDAGFSLAFKILKEEES